MNIFYVRRYSKICLYSFYKWVKRICQKVKKSQKNYIKNGHNYDS